MDNKKEDKIAAIVSFSFLGLFLIYSIIGLKITESMWSDTSLNKKYTIGKITSFEPRAKSPPGFNFEFKVKNRLYKEKYLITDDIGNVDYDKLRTFKHR